MSWDKKTNFFINIFLVYEQPNPITLLILEHVWYCLHALYINKVLHKNDNEFHEHALIYKTFCFKTNTINVFFRISLNQVGKRTV